MRFHLSMVLSSIVLVSGHSSLDAQACFGVDGLDGPCGLTVLETLPNFPAITIGGSALHWIDCTPMPKVQTQMMISPPLQISCGSYTSTMDVFDPFTGSVLASGTLELTYSRTWDEIDPAGNVHQVWRFLAMGMIDTPPGPFFLPSDLPSYYHGYIDYSVACSGGLFWEHAVVLQHNCDRFLHMPAWSAVPGAFDPVMTYAFVAPDTPANPFDPAVIPPPFTSTPGAVTIGALRDPVPAPGACCTRDPVLQAVVQPLANACLCPFSFNLPPRNFASRLSAFGGCGGGIVSLDTLPLGLPWLNMISTAIGSWTTPAGYPGPETASVYEGVCIWQESCSPQRFAEVQYGAATSNGWTWSSAIIGPAPPQMLDLRSNWSNPIPGPIGLPIVGDVFPSPFQRHVLYLTAP